MSLILDFPKWFLLLCPLTGLLYTAVLYFRDKSLNEIPVIIQRIMAVLRFVAVTVIVFLLLGPFFRAEKKQIIKPVIVVAQDNTQSLVIGKDSSYYRGKYLAEFQNFINKISEKYDVKTYTFGNEVKEGLSVDYSEKVTIFNDFFKEIYTRYVNRNLGAMIIASDGIYNQGVSPSSWMNRFNESPIYTIALGDTTIRKDLIISDVEHNRLAYLGNDFPINVTIASKKCQDHLVKLSIFQNNVELISKEIGINSPTFSQSFNFNLEAKSIGLQRYRVQVSSIDGELTYVNNYRDIFIEVLDSRQKILILANSPHPDINAIKTAIKNNKNYEVKTKIVDNFSGNLQEYSLIIFHQLPTRNANSDRLISEAKKLNIPSLFIIGSQTNISAFNALNLNLSINGYKNSLTPANGAFNKEFVLFNAHENISKELPRFPPLLIPFGDYALSKGATILAYQKIGPQLTDYPLIFFNKETSYKTAVICGEGIWRWKFNEFREQQDNEIFDDLIQKTIQYMASKENRNFFRVFGKTDFLENENILFDAEVYNESYELVNTSTVNMIITSKDGDAKKYSFSPTANAYRLDAGKFSVGDYNWEATVTFNGKTYSEKGEFSVSALNIEMVNSIANHQLLLDLSNTTKGKMYYPGQWDEMANHILNSEDIVSISRVTKETQPIIEYRIIFFLLILLLGSEWFLRKRWGTY